MKMERNPIQKLSAYKRKGQIITSAKPSSQRSTKSADVPDAVRKHRQQVALPLVLRAAAAAVESQLFSVPYRRTPYHAATL